MADENPQLRCADSDRERVVEELREHYAAGRLTLDEFQERSDTAYAAKTFGDLGGLTADLPAAALEPAKAKEPARRLSPGVRRAWSSWFAVSMVCTVVWLLGVLSAGDLTYFWPMWVMGPWGVMLIVGTLGNRGGGNGGERHEVEGEQRARQLEEHRRRTDLRFEHRHDRLRHQHERRRHHNRPPGEVS
ncbi:MAG: DUF1707 domain-containing protein [Streptosporangiales bacterium]|nr:DUF1707 domain-containing protein [Streptosporangiales bacterium]